MNNINEEPNFKFGRFGYWQCEYEMDSYISKTAAAFIASSDNRYREIFVRLLIRLIICQETDCLH
jgi:hypothetical protein